MIFKNFFKDSSNQLIYFGIIFEIIFLLLFLIVHYKNRFSGDISIPPSDSFSIIAFFFWSLIAIFIYSIFSLRNFLKNNLFLIVLFYFIFSLTLFFTWPFGSADLLNYIDEARVFTQYFHNPFITPSAVFANDLTASFIEFARFHTTIYGPLWLLISFVPNFLFGDSLIPIFLILKLLAVFFNLGCVILIYLILKKIRPGIEYLGTLLYAWNPLIIFEAAQNGHNDFIMLFFILLAIYFFVENKLTWVLPALVAAFLVKITALILFPLFSIFIYKRLKRKKIIFFIKTGLLSFILAFIFYLPFWQGIEIFTKLFKTMSIIVGPSVFQSVLRAFFNFENNQLYQICIILFLLVYLIILIRAFLNPKSDLIVLSFWTFFYFIFISLNWVRPWYFVWPLIFSCLLIDQKKYIHLTLFITAIALIDNYLPLFISVLFAALPYLFYYLFKKITTSPLKFENELN